jgi:tRNA 2-thiouridine synthesizing protein A
MAEPTREKTQAGEGGIRVVAVDARGLFCPLPIVKLKLALEKVPSGDAVEILADDPGFPEDVVSWCEETGNDLLSLRPEGNGAFVACVRKR